MDTTSDSKEASTCNGNRSDIYMNLSKLCLDNEEFFVNDESEYGLRLHEAFHGLRCHIESILPLVSEIREVIYEYNIAIK